MTPSEIVPRAELVKATREVATSTGPVVATAALLTVTDASSYAYADEVLKRIRDARKRAEARINVIIDPIRTALESLYKLRKEVDGPLSLAESQVKDKMRVFQIAETDRINTENRARAAEAERLRVEAQKRQELADKATRPSVKAALDKKADSAFERLIEVESKPIAEAPRASGSAVRKTKKVTVIDFAALVQAVASGQIPMDVLSCDLQIVRSYYRGEPDVVAQWPGVEIVEEVSIVGR